MLRGLSLIVSIAAGALLATPTFAATAPTSPRSISPSGWTGDICANVAAEAQDRGTATNSDLADCTLAVRLAGYAGDRAVALANRSVLHYIRGEYDASMADSTAALKLNDHLAEAVVNRGAVFLLQHRPQAAAANFTFALTLAPEHLEKIYFDRAMAREDMGDVKGAYADYIQASELNPQWSQPREQLERFKVVPEKPIS